MQVDWPYRRTFHGDHALSQDDIWGAPEAQNIKVDHHSPSCADRSYERCCWPTNGQHGANALVVGYIPSIKTDRKLMTEMIVSQYSQNLKF